MEGFMEPAQKMEVLVNIPIQLDSVCSTLGIFTPRWFRYEDSRHEIYTIKINRIVNQKEINFVGIKMLQFICASDFEGRERIFELRYHLTSHRWIFFQMLS